MQVLFIHLPPVPYALASLGGRRSGDATVGSVVPWDPHGPSVAAAGTHGPKVAAGSWLYSWWLHGACWWLLDWWLHGLWWLLIQAVFYFLLRSPSKTIRHRWKQICAKLKRKNKPWIRGDHPGGQSTDMCEL
eukprot:826770-Pelagomonas_calceolata.AAC.3